jgi:hypothetical protein
MNWTNKLRNFYKSYLFIYIAFILAVSTMAPLAKVFADSADPVLPISQGTVAHNNDGSNTVTMRGQWQWTTHQNKDCNEDRYAVGYAIDWHDPTQPGNTITGTDSQHKAITAHVGTPTDNYVHFIHLATDTPSNNDPVGATRCGVYAGHGADKKGKPVSYNIGYWGPISHTYPSTVTSVSACVVTYDIHSGSNGLPKTGDLIAGGSGHNDDNSIQSNGNTPAGNGCFSPSFALNVIPVSHVTDDNGQILGAATLAKTGQPTELSIITGLGILTAVSAVSFVARRQNS